MDTDPAAFDRNIDNWKQGHDTPWGHLRRSMAYANIASHLPQKRLKVLDAGGGDGLDSIPLAKKGHRVALVDYSDEMLQEARANGAEEGVGERMSFHHGEVGSIPQRFEAASHDVVLLHNVLTYVDDPKEALECATYPLRSGGLLSLMQINRYSEAMGAAVRMLDLDDAYEKIDAKTGTAKPFGNVPVKRYAPEEMIALLEAQGFELVQQYGILCVCNYIWDNEIKYEPEFFRKLERLEAAMSTKFPYYLQARFCHLIAVKQA